MNVIDARHVEDCFDGSIIKEVLLSEEIPKELIFALGTEGTVQYFDSFARPFFKVRVKGKFDIKGIQGNTTMRVHLKEPAAFSMHDFIARINHWQSEKQPGRSL